MYWDVHWPRSIHLRKTIHYDQVDNILQHHWQYDFLNENGITCLNTIAYNKVQQLQEANKKKRSSKAVLSFACITFYLGSIVLCWNG